jgi:hypothetical protein
MYRSGAAWLTAHARTRAPRRSSGARGPLLPAVLATLIGIAACTEGESSSSAYGELQLLIEPGATPTTIYDLEGNASITHPSGDEPTFVWSWECVCAVDPSGFTTRIVESSNTVKHETWWVTVYAEFSDRVTDPITAEFDVINSPPTIPFFPRPVISGGPDGGTCTKATFPASIGDVCTTISDCGRRGERLCEPQADSTLEAPVTTSDDDGDLVTVAYQWSVNSVPVSTSETLPPSFFDVGDLVEVEITPNDGEEDGETEVPAPVTIQPAQ